MKPCPSTPIKHLLSEGNEALILAIEKLSKKMIAPQARWVRWCNPFDFEMYLYEQIALDTETSQSLDTNRREEILMLLREYGCSEKYFDIFSAYELWNISQYKAAIRFR